VGSVLAEQNDEWEVAPLLLCEISGEALDNRLTRPATRSGAAGGSSL